MRPFENCPDCAGGEFAAVNRRQFVKTIGVTAVAASSVSLTGTAFAKEAAGSGNASRPETFAQKLYASLTPTQRQKISFPWDYTDMRGLLRMHVENNWQITEEKVASDFFTKDQQDIIEALYKLFSTCIRRRPRMSV